MATLVVDLHCMCLFVPGEKFVHVLMPDMSGGRHGGHDAHHGEQGHQTAEENRARHEHGGTPGYAAEESEAGRGSPGGNGTRMPPDKHVVSMWYRSAAGTWEEKSMERWELILNGQGPANLRLNDGTPLEPELPDLTIVSEGRVVDSSLITSTCPKGVISRVTLQAGAVSQRHSDPYKWKLGGKKDRNLANAITWVIPDAPDELTWVSLGATGSTLPQSLRELKPEANDLYRISIRHETPRTTGDEQGLTADEIKHHFAAYYGLLGMDPLPHPGDPRYDHYFPKINDGRSGSVLCRSSMARLTV